MKIQTAKIHFLPFLSFLCILAILLTLPAVAYASPGQVQNGWMNYYAGGYLYIPASFSAENASGNSLREGYTYQYYNPVQNMEITTSERDVSNYYGDILTENYNTYVQMLPKAVYNVKTRSEFTLSGYHGRNIYYIQNTLAGGILYTIEFDYPTANRLVCDPIVEQVCNSFATSGMKAAGTIINRPSSADLDLIRANIKYPNYAWMYLDTYMSAVVSHNKAVYCFRDPDTDVWRQGNYFTVYRGTEVTILAQSEGYACVILNGTNKAGWINMDYLSMRGTTNSPSVR